MASPPSWAVHCNLHFTFNSSIQWFFSTPLRRIQPCHTFLEPWWKTPWPLPPHPPVLHLSCLWNQCHIDNVTKFCYQLEKELGLLWNSCISFCLLTLKKQFLRWLYLNRELLSIGLLPSNDLCKMGPLVGGILPSWRLSYCPHSDQEVSLQQCWLL